jgi:hypothetical protein
VALPRRALRRRAFPCGRVDAAPVEFPLATAAQRAGDQNVLGPPWAASAPVEVPIRESPPIDDVVRSRGSIKLLDRTRSVCLELFRTSMLAATRGIDVPHVVAVHAVDGMAPGIYWWPETTPRRTGDIRDELYRLALEQGFAQEAAFVTIATSDVTSLGDRGYREAQLGAGLVEGRLHLLAYALGAARAA